MNTLIKEIDYGTPKSEVAKMVTLEIDPPARPRRRGAGPARD